MIKSYHCLTQPAKNAEIYYEDINDDIFTVLTNKCRKLIKQLKAAKLTYPEKANDLDWFIDAIETGVLRNTDFDKELAFKNNFYHVRYEKDKFVLIIKENNGIMSVRSYLVEK